MVGLIVAPAVLRKGYLCLILSVDNIVGSLLFIVRNFLVPA